ncbi:hypothetical protein [uncultured Neisseria sp.]|nr:hypothetical protein [uncultured Neisseria sp.]
MANKLIFCRNYRTVRTICGLLPSWAACYILPAHILKGRLKT